MKHNPTELKLWFKYACKKILVSLNVTFWDKNVATDI